MQAGMYSSTTEAFTQIVKKQGIAGLYQGYLGGITRDVPFRVAQLTTYELTKNCYLRIKKFRQNESKDSSASQELSPVESAVCGAVAGTFSAGITAPLDRIKTLMMTDKAAYGGTVASCVAKIWQEVSSASVSGFGRVSWVTNFSPSLISHHLLKEGIGGFATGLVPRVVYIAPSVVIFFVAYEQVQQRLKHWQS